MDEILKKVKIGGLRYTVSEVEDLGHVERSPGMLGCIDYHQLTLKIEKNIHSKMQEQTFIHELAHGILVEAGYEDHEEEQANRIGKVLYQVLKDNDFSFIRKG